MTTSQSVHFSSLNLHWQTPLALYEKLNSEFHFDFDPCPPNPDFDGLMIEWGARNFVNPPYGRTLALWIRKAYEQRQLGKLVVLLVPSRTDTAWWHDYVMKSRDIRFVRGRLHFEEPEDRRRWGGGRGAPFPSAVVVFRPPLAIEKGQP